MSDSQAANGTLLDLAALLEEWSGRHVDIEITDRVAGAFLAGLCGRVDAVEWDDEPAPGRLRVRLHPGPQELLLFADLVDEVSLTSRSVAIDHHAAGEIVITLSDAPG